MLRGISYHQRDSVCVCQELNNFRWHLLSNSALSNFWKKSAQTIPQRHSQPQTGQCKGNIPAVFCALCGHTVCGTEGQCTSWAAASALHRAPKPCCNSQSYLVQRLHVILQVPPLLMLVLVKGICISIGNADAHFFQHIVDFPQYVKNF